MHGEEIITSLKLTTYMTQNLNVIYQITTALLGTVSVHGLNLGSPKCGSNLFPITKSAPPPPLIEHIRFKVQRFMTFSTAKVMHVM